MFAPSYGGSVRRPLALLGSVADDGTRSICQAFSDTLKPARVHLMRNGFKRSGWRSLVKGMHFIHEADSEGMPVLCLFNAPVLLAALTPRIKRARRIGILDWTEAYPSGRRGPGMWMYNHIYAWAFKRLDVVASPVAGFRDYYDHYGADVCTCLYPLPRLTHYFHSRSQSRGAVRLLYIGADYKRKGGDVLLEMWERGHPRSVELTFVCPHPPTSAMKGVRFLTEVRAGSEEHLKLFADHDLLVLPTRQDPFGYVLLEAVSAGLAVATTRAAGAADLVSEAGGFVASTPEQAVSQSFEACQSETMLSTAKSSAAQFCKVYQSRFESHLFQLIGNRGRN